MSRTVNADGSVRYAPDRGHRVRRRPTPAVLVVIVGGAVTLGAASFRQVGGQRGWPIVVGTVAVTLLAVLMWRLTLPRMLSVTVSTTEITYRSYGRTSTVLRNGNLRAAVRLVLGDLGVNTPYVVVTGDGGQFKLNADMWSDDDLEVMSRDLGQVSAPGVATWKQLDEEFPGLLPVYVRRPNVSAVVFIVVALVLIIGTGAVISVVRGEDDSRTYVPSGRITDSDLPAAASASQNALQADVQGVFGDASGWLESEPEADSCIDQDGWQRDLVAAVDEVREPLTPEEVDGVTAAAERAGLAQVDSRTGGSGTEYLRFQDDSTGAELKVIVEGGYLRVETSSACTTKR